MKRLTNLAACTCVLACCTQVFGGIVWDTVVFEDQFCSAEVTRPDPQSWVVNHPPEWWWKMGRTHFPNPDPWLPTGEFPRVENGALIVEHHLYNPHALYEPWFLGGEVHTVQEFEPSRPYRFEARLRWNEDPPYVPYRGGVVNSFFLYGYDGSNSDEIDFEFLSNQMLNDPEEVFTNAWNESLESPQHVLPGGVFDPRDWNTFRIYWYPGEPRIEWVWVVNPETGEEVVLRTETDPLYVPDESMALYFNFWAASEIWPKAYDSLLQPVSDLDDNEIFAYEIDYVQVAVPEPHSIMFLVAGAAWLWRRRGPCGRMAPK